MLSLRRHPSSVTLHRVVMDPFTPLQMAMREWARRFLKHTKISTESPPFIADKILATHQYYNEKVPSQFSELTQNNHIHNSIQLYHNDILIGQLGGEVPDSLLSVFIPTSNLQQLWDDIELIIRELILAGYPGCIGCGGPGSEEIWDEAISRIY